MWKGYGTFWNVERCLDFSAGGGQRWATPPPTALLRSPLPSPLSPPIQIPTMAQRLAPTTPPRKILKQHLPGKQNKLLKTFEDS